MKVIAFCLYGDKEIYSVGALENAKLVKQIYGEEWEGIFYIEEGHKIIPEIEKYATVITMKNHWLKHRTYWRLLPTETCSITLIRDVDSRLNLREKELVEEWLKTDKLVHIIRDHPIHNFRMMTGMIGIKKSDISLMELLNKNPEYNREQYILDQLFLQNIYYPLIKDKVLIHDAYHKYLDETTITIPRTMEYIGERVLESGITEKEDMWNRTKNRYIFFVEELDCFNTEQCCAFLYKLMEYIQIARKTNRTLVLSNIYLSPRDNNKSIEEKRVVIKKVEYIGLDNFLDLEELKKTVNIITATDYYQILLDNKIESLLIKKPKEEVPIMNNKLFTYIGKIDVNIIEYEYSSLNILSFVTNNIVDEFESLIVYNYNRMGNPIWYNIENLEYFGIRHSIVFNKRLTDIADKFVETHNIRNNTMMFHWRRGDKANIKDTKFHMTTEKETDNWLMNFDRICSMENVKKNIKNVEQVLLITNNGDKNEMEEFRLHLKNKGIKLIEMSNDKYNNLTYHDFDIMSIIVGAQCKYHLHSPTNYNRMSMFGRWMIEEKYIYYTNNNWFYNILQDVSYLV